MNNYPLSSSTWDNKELEAINSVIKSNNYTMGAQVIQFENNFRKFINRKYCLMVSSGSAANLISIASFFYTKRPMLKKKRRGYCSSRILVYYLLSLAAIWS